MEMLLLILTGICSLTDLRDGRIYNAVLVPMTLLGLVLRVVPLFGGSMPAFVSAMQRMGLVLVLLVPFWILFPQGIGGGDIKLYAAIAVFLEINTLFLFMQGSLLIAACDGLIRRYLCHRRGRMRIGPAALCAAALYVGGIYG